MSSSGPRCGGRLDEGRVCRCSRHSSRCLRWQSSELERVRLRRRSSLSWRDKLSAASSSDPGRGRGHCTRCGTTQFVCAGAGGCHTSSRDGASFPPSSCSHCSSSPGDNPGFTARSGRREFDPSALRARWAPTSAAPGQDVPEHEGDRDHSRRDSDHGDCRSGHDHAALISPLSAGETPATAAESEERPLPPPPLRHQKRLFVNPGRVLAAHSLIDLVPMRRDLLQGAGGS
jgi:hypothetical protein